MRNLFIRLAKISLGLLGTAAINSCDGHFIGKAEYGCPHADFEAKGTVTDEDGNGIPGIRVIIRSQNPLSSNPKDRLEETIWTNHNGEYVSGESYYDDDFAYTSSIKMEFEDVDGPENGGEFQKVNIEVPVFQVKEGDGKWYNGAYEAGANVTMHKK